MQTWITPQPIQSVLSALIASLESASLTVLMPTSPRNRIEQADAGVSGHRILEVFSPIWFQEISEMDPRAAIELPLRIHLYASHGQTHLTYRTARESMTRYPSPAIASWAQAIDQNLFPVFTAVGQAG